MQRDAGRVHPFIFAAAILPFTSLSMAPLMCFPFSFLRKGAIIEPLLDSGRETELTDYHCSSLSSQEGKHIAFRLQRNVCRHRDVAALAENVQFRVKVRTAALQS